MKRTQIYLQESQKEELDKLALQKGRALADLIREAVDMYIADNKLKKTKEHIIETSGLWKNRDDIDSVEYVNGLRNELAKRLEDNS
ncbi:MAG: CopG family transcriptional regulator [Bacillota bacterium]